MTASDRSVAPAHWDEVTASERPSGEQHPPADSLVGWKAIAARLGVSTRTAMRWADRYGLPVARLPRNGRPLIHAEPEEVDSWFRSAEAREALLTEPITFDAGEPVEELESKPCARPDEGRGRWLAAVRLGVVAVILAVVGLLTYPALRNAAARVSPLTIPGRLQGGAHGKAEAAGTIRLDVGPAGGPNARVRVRNGEMVRIETASVRAGLHATHRGDRLEVWAFRLTPAGTGESAQYVAERSLSLGVVQSLAILDQRFNLIWLPETGSKGPPDAAGPRRACCMVCDGFTACGESVEASCGQCTGLVKNTGAGPAASSPTTSR